MRPHAVVTLTLLCSCVLAWAGGDASRLDTPSGGWNVFGLVDHGDEMVAAYPTPPVDRGRQKNRTLIRGRLVTGAPPGEVPKLIVNGNAMPLYGNPDGT